MRRYDLSCGCEYCEWRIGGSNFAGHLNGQGGITYRCQPLILNGQRKWSLHKQYVQSRVSKVQR
jgi:hypothetical protein